MQKNDEEYEHSQAFGRLNASIHELKTMLALLCWRNISTLSCSKEEIEAMIRSGQNHPVETDGSSITFPAPDQ